MLNRDDYLASAKARALRLVDDNDFDGAYTSLANDLRSHPQFNHLGTVSLLATGYALLLSGYLRQPDAMRKWIEAWQ